MFKQKKAPFLTRIFFLAACLLSTMLVSLQKSSSRFDLLSDILRPLGMPLVTVYHAIRESIFLNVRAPSPTPLQATGDFLLSPSQFLFAGKTISFLNEEDLEYQLVPIYNYEHLFWLKSLSSLIALPIAQPLGMGCKALSYLSKDVRQKHQRIKQALFNFYTTSHVSDYLNKGICSLYGQGEIVSQGHKRPSFLTSEQQADLQAFKEVVALLEKHQIPYWVDCGTCLGVYRYGGMIPWDIDIDIAIFQQDHENVKRLLTSLDPKKYQIQDWSSYSHPGTFLKPYIKETKNLLDIYHYQFLADQPMISYFYSYEESPFPDSWKKEERKCTAPVFFDQVFPLRRAVFDGIAVWAPNQIVPYLQSKYGHNLDPSMVWNEEQKAYLKVDDHPYWKD